MSQREIAPWQEFRELGLAELLRDAPPSAASCTLLCRDCVVAKHSRRPDHFAQEWTGHRFTTRTWVELGLLVHLGHRGGHCSVPQWAQLLLMTLQGLSRVRVGFCRCEAALPDDEQLKQIGWIQIRGSSDAVVAEDFANTCNKLGLC
ncbi:hypothetical protein FB451DRAFT_1418643 [Mycena latifolia]|nr:hypothetical protein FB451DRAFT_1418643 [Mycena latifolia]